MNKEDKTTLIMGFILLVLVLFGAFASSEINSTQASEKPSQVNYEETTTIPETTETTTETVCEVESLGKFTITAYCSCERCCGKYAKNRPTDEHGNEIVITASGKVAESGKTIAVDPDVISYGTVVMIDGQEYTAADTLSPYIIDIYNGRVIDIYFDNHDEAVKYGKQTHEVEVKG